MSASVCVQNVWNVWLPAESVPVRPVSAIVPPACVPVWFDPFSPTLSASPTFVPSAWSTHAIESGGVLNVRHWPVALSSTFPASARTNVVLAQTSPLPSSSKQPESVPEPDDPTESAMWNSDTWFCPMSNWLTVPSRIFSSPLNPPLPNGGALEMSPAWIDPSPTSSLPTAPDPMSSAPRVSGATFGDVTESFASLSVATAPFWMSTFLTSPSRIRVVVTALGAILPVVAAPAPRSEVLTSPLTMSSLNTVFDP